MSRARAWYAFISRVAFHDKLSLVPELRLLSSNGMHLTITQCLVPEPGILSLVGMLFTISRGSVPELGML